MSNKTLRSLEEAMEIFGGTCAECERKHYSLPGRYDSITYSNAKAIFHCSKGGRNDHKVSYRLGFRASESDFMELEKEFRHAENADDAVKKYVLDAMMRKLDVYAVLAEKGLEYDIGFTDADGRPVHAKVGGRKVDLVSEFYGDVEYVVI